MTWFRSNIGGGERPKPTKFRYLKWHITANGGNDYIQVSDFGFKDSEGTRYSFPAGMTATSSLPLLSGNNIYDLFDGDTSTKIVLSYNTGDVEDIIIDLGSQLDITEYPYYYWCSSDDDSQFLRQPRTWQLYGSNNSNFSDQVLLDDVLVFAHNKTNRAEVYSAKMLVG